MFHNSSNFFFNNFSKKKRELDFINFHFDFSISFTFPAFPPRFSTFPPLFPEFQPWFPAFPPLSPAVPPWLHTFPPKLFVFPPYSLHSSYSPHSQPHSLHSHLDSPHPPDSSHSPHFPHSIPGFPIPAFTDSPLDILLFSFAKDKHYNLKKPYNKPSFFIYFSLILFTVCFFVDKEMSHNSI